MTHQRTLTAAHWGVYEVEYDDAGNATKLHPFSKDPDPSPIGLHMLSDEVSRLRVLRPSIRKSWLEKGPGANPELRGQEPFVEVPWDEALDLLAGELKRVKETYSNRAIFGGSYGWSSAGRFHHAQSQVKRFLNCYGGFVRHQDSYSLGAARVLMPHIVASMEELMAMHTRWDVLAKECKLFVTFGGVPHKNAQINAGGATLHHVKGGLYAMREAGVRFVNVTPTAEDLDNGGDVEWLAIRPNTDAALMLALCHTLLAENLHDRAFLDRYTVGFDKFAATLKGKDAAWAEKITGIPAHRIVSLAREMAATRTMLSIGWSLQRSHHGEQPFWALVTLACMLGQIGLPGGGFGVGYGPVNLMGSPHPRYSGPTLPQGKNPVPDFIPVARFTDMLLHPGERFDYNGRSHVYPDIRLVYWAGGNPYHHHQDLNRLRQAWRKPDTIVFHEQFWTPAAKMADVVLPATTSLERDDIGYGTREPYVIAMKKAREPLGESRNDYDIFNALAERLGVGEAHSEGRKTTQEWLSHLYEEARVKSAKAGVTLPPYAEFWEAGIAEARGESRDPVMLAAFRADPEKNKLKTPSGKFEIFSETIASFGYDDCPGHATWLEPIEWLGAKTAERYPLHMLSDQPADKLHSQLDHSPHAKATKIKGRQPITLHPDDATARGIAAGDLVRVFNDRGACLAAARVSDRIRRGVVRLSTGAWFDPADAGSNRPLEKHGNPNALTLDIGASKLSQGCIAQTCLVEIERFDGPAPAVTAHQPPTFAGR
ncbi:molybdopterin-dependent oxidoreductase [Reyranella massiliensis]|uniref:molybdopterin-dependent oxidoreductase n=1 Tax=Reyranella massiliensis TaxID=445220 RepID=UPI0002EB84C0|nr:molybdopterin-dependent oxidoreductase [Reyranella massiliensis]